MPETHTQLLLVALKPKRKRDRRAEMALLVAGQKGRNGRFVKTLQQRLFPKISATSMTECWNWSGGLTRGGYGKFCHLGKMIDAHKAMWIYLFGDPSPLWVLHKCDNRKCVNPLHLFLGTRRDNMDDMVKKGRQVRGVKNHNSKLTEADVLKIREMCSAGKVNYSELGLLFGIGGVAVRKVAKGQTWMHVK